MMHRHPCYYKIETFLLTWHLDQQVPLLGLLDAEVVLVLVAQQDLTVNLNYQVYEEVLVLLVWLILEQVVDSRHHVEILDQKEL
jgi:hypothetical protein